MLAQGENAAYMENYFGWAFEFLKNYLIWKESYQTATAKLNSIRHNKEWLIKQYNERRNSITSFENEIKALEAAPESVPQYPAQPAPAPNAGGRKKGAFDKMLFGAGPQQKQFQPLQMTKQQKIDSVEYKMDILKIENEIYNDRYKECRAEEEIAVKNLEEITKHYREATKIKNRHYEIDVIPPANRHLLEDITSVALLHYYLASGICNEVTGRNGIYSKYEEDMQHQEVIHWLREIKNSIDDFHADYNFYQRELIGEMQKMNSSISGIQSSLNSLSSELGSIREMNETVNRQNTATLNYLQGVAWDSYMRRG